MSGSSRNFNSEEDVTQNPTRKKYNSNCWNRTIMKGTVPSTMRCIWRCIDGLGCRVYCKCCLTHHIKNSDWM